MVDLAGRTFGSLVVINAVPVKYKVLCRCVCGTEKLINQYRLLSGATKSCGCQRAQSIGRASITHGMCGSRVYNIWHKMHQRCGNPNGRDYRYYGARGITVCRRWLRFENFLADMGEPPTAKHTVDRRDTNKGYGPDNCRWATHKEQNNNHRHNRLIAINGVTKTLTQWADEYRVPPTRVRARLNAGYDPIHALTAQPWERRSRP